MRILLLFYSILLSNFKNKYKKGKRWTCKVSYTLVLTIRFADDIVLVTDTEHNLQRSLERDANDWKRK